MRTLIFQSYRRSDIPAYIRTCLDTVRVWAEGRGYAYQMSGDEIFERVPSDLRAKCFGHSPKITDLARLYLARDFLAEGYDRVVWLDADVLVFAAESLKLDDTMAHGFGREIWVQKDGKGRWRSYRHIHNAICVFQRGNPVLEYLIHTSEQIIGRQSGPTAPQLIGPKLLSALHNIAPFPLIETVGMISPPVMRDLLSGGGPALECQLKSETVPLAAVNLSSSLVGKTLDGVAVTEPLFEDICAHLLRQGSL